MLGHSQIHFTEQYTVLLDDKGTKTFTTVTTTGLRFPFFWEVIIDHLAIVHISRPLRHLEISGINSPVIQCHTSGQWQQLHHCREA